jgi:hypothetical protein
MGMAAWWEAEGRKEKKKDRKGERGSGPGFFWRGIA